MIRTEPPFPWIDLSVGEQKVGDDRERRRPQLRRDPSGGGLHYSRWLLLFDQPLHAIDESADGLA